MMRTAVSTTIVGIGKDFLTLIFLICVMFHRDSMLATFAFIIFPSLIIPISVIGRRMKRVVESTQDNLGTFSGYLSQIFQGIRIVKAYNAEDFESKRARNKMDTLFKLIVRSAKIKSSLHPLSEFICGLAIVVVLSYGDFQITHGYKTAGDLISFLAALLFSYDPLKKLTHLSANLQEGLASANRIFRILDTKPRVKSLESHNYLAKEVECIEFKNVCFSYDPSRNVLDNVTFSVLKSQTVALVGKSGTGKSTILNLLSRFYDPTGGEIRINGANIKALPLQHLRNLIAIVTQETILFDASFYDNIAYGNPTASKEDILAASKAALADDFISKTPYGYDTIIGENGIRISGGQRQRIAIARAMLKNAPVLLLDEATSSLDSNSEKAVQVALEELMKNRTTLVVTHRLSTIIDANMIYVLDDGKIIENGSHSDLIFMKGAYYKFWNMRN
jgi:subfamily B ATP-binding cassette protein MsbA